MLACADSNVAADNLCNKIQQLVPHARVLRVGDGGSEELRDQVLEGTGKEFLDPKEKRLARMEAMQRQLPHAQVGLGTSTTSRRTVLVL